MDMSEIQGEIPVYIYSVAFGEDFVQIDFMEKRHQSTAAVKRQSITIDLQHIEEEVIELQDLLLELVDKGHVLISHPPKRRAGGLKLAQEAAEAAEAEDAEGDEQQA